YCLIYLTVNGRDPNPQSMTKALVISELEKHRLLLLSYCGDVAAWLDQCIATCESEKLRWFLRDFKNYIQTNLSTSSLPEGDADAR
ncbi:MAG: hypothetical protein ACRETQ_03830, partial [Gammaproteobacteria bacterium]